MASVSSGIALLAARCAVQQIHLIRQIWVEMDHVKTLWFNKFGFQKRSKLSDESSRYLKTHLDELLEIVLPPMIELVPNCDGVSYDEPLKMGFAMKANQKLPKITEELKTFV